MLFPNLDMFWEYVRRDWPLEERRDDNDPVRLLDLFVSSQRAQDVNPGNSAVRYLSKEYDAASLYKVDSGS